MSEPEKLTKEERAAFTSWQELRAWPELRDKALRIIDAHAAERAALVAQLAQCQRDLAECARERDEARAKLRHARYTAQVRWGGFKPDWPAGARDVYEALDADGYSHSDSGVDGVVGSQEVTRLTRERDEAVSDHDAIHEQLRDAQSEVTRLTAALAAANRGAAENGEAADTYRERAEAAEARVRELEAKAERLIVEVNRVDANLEEQRGALDARVDALEVLLAASEARAAQWQADAESYRADATVAQDRLAALKAKVERAVQRLTYDEELLAETRIARALEALRG